MTIAGGYGVAANLLNLPYGIIVDSSNAVYIADQYNNRVQKWTAGASTGTTVAGQAAGTWGTVANSLYYPAGITLDSNGSLYVVDSNNHRVQLWLSGASSGSTIAGTGHTVASNTEMINFPFCFRHTRCGKQPTLFPLRQRPR